MIYKLKNRVILNHAPTPTQLHTAPLSSIHLHPAPPSLFQVPTSFLQHPQYYKNENTARNWKIHPNLYGYPGIYFEFIFNTVKGFYCKMNPFISTLFLELYRICRSV